MEYRKTDNIAKFQPAEYLYSIYLNKGDTIKSHKYSDFLANNAKNSVTLEDIYFPNPSTHIADDAIGERLDNASIRIHGFKGSTAEEYCRKYGEKYNLIFVEL